MEERLNRIEAELAKIAARQVEELAMMEEIKALLKAIEENTR